ncbi:MAG: LysR family transcriptional regulator [Pseudomonadota bacterium]|nr:LysR family transcriptional regulator [Pseudomonadota bacterium]
MKIPKFDLLETLVSVAESKNFLEAAHRLELSQGAVSLKLKALQEHLPLPLFTLKGKRKILTPYGNEIYKYARVQLDRSLADFGVVSRKYMKPENTVLKISCRRELFQSLYSRLDFGGSIHFEEASGREALRLLLERKVDLALTYIKPDLTEVIARPILDSRCHLLVHKKHVKAHGSKFFRSEEFLTTVPCLIYTGGGHLLDKWVRHLGIDFSKLRPRVIAEDWGILRDLIDEGHGYAVAPDFVQTRSADVVSVEIPSLALETYKYYAIFFKDLKQIPAIKNVLKSIEMSVR